MTIYEFLSTRVPLSPPEDFVVCFFALGCFFGITAVTSHLFPPLIYGTLSAV